MDEVTSKALTDYLDSGDILIVDSSTSARKAMAASISHLGVKPGRIIQTGDFNSARDVIKKIKPKVVISEYLINNGTGINLSEEFNLVRDVADSVFILLTANSSQSLVAQAAEEDVDIYILKPYTMNYLQGILSKVVLKKINPDGYDRNIQEGKKKLATKQLEEALKTFEDAIQLNATPTLAYYYKSQVEILKRLLDRAEESLQNGLSFNEIHFKCLTGLFELYLERDKLDEAYQMVNQLTTFPLTPKRFSKIVDLAVKTANYDDIDHYYEAFRAINYQDIDVVKHINAALVVSSKMLFQRGEHKRAVSFLKKASLSSKEMPTILMEIVATLAMNQSLPEAQAALAIFPKEDESEYQYQVASFMTAFYEGTDTNPCLLAMQKMADQNQSDATQFYWLIAMLQATDQNPKANEYQSKALKIWPDKSDYFQKAWKMIPARKVN